MVDALSCRPPGFGSVDDGGLDAIPPGVETATFAPSRPPWQRRGMSAPTAPTEVDFHFDLMCPFAYQTSVWIRRVREQTDLTINWRFFSLEEVNRQPGKKHPWQRE